MKEALYYRKSDGVIVCELCPHYCHLKENQIGRCRVRKHIAGKLMSLSYGRISGLQVDPIEKKPLLQFCQGTRILSIGSFGCNMRCGFCQNHEISMNEPETLELTPLEIVEKTKGLSLPSIAYTYNEPTTFYEMMLETARLANKNGLLNVVVTNGLINEAPLKALLPYIDAMNIDLKSYYDAIYQELGGTKVDDVLNTIALAAKACHVEVTLLIVPGVSDNIEAFRDLMARLKAVAPNVVLHLSRYFPRYQYNEAATSISLMMDLKEIAKEHFNHVYLGNV